MGRFYLDLEFTNGNYYLADIIELALLSEETGNVFHSYIRIHYLIPKRVKELTTISDDTLASIGCSFKDTFVALNDFIKSETLQDESKPLIIAHAGFLFDFPILVTNCMKHKIQDFGILQHCLFADSIEVLRENGYQRPGLDSLCQQFGLMRDVHSALGDVQLLKKVFYNQHIHREHIRTFEKVVFDLKQKLSVRIIKIYEWARKCHSHHDLEIMLVKFVKKKTALTSHQMFKIAFWYFKDRHVICK